MNSNRSSRSSINFSGRASPNLNPSKNDSLLTRSGSPPTSSSHPTLHHKKELSKSDSTKSLSAEDTKFYKAVFDRCADAPTRVTITKREKFALALSYAGYDLPDDSIEQIWSRHERKISFYKFTQIMNDREGIDDEQLSQAFEKLFKKDSKHSSTLIDYDRFRTDILENGNRLTENEFEKVRFLLGTEGGMFDYKKLIKSIEENKKNCRQWILKEEKEKLRDHIETTSPRSTLPQKEKDVRINQNRITIEIDPSSDEPFVPPRGYTSRMIKGAFFCEYTESSTVTYLSIGYKFEIKRPTPIWITLEPKTTMYHKDLSFKNLDNRILLFERMPRSKDKRLIHMSSERLGNKSCLKVDNLSSGSYEIIPVTFGGLLRARTHQEDNLPPSKKLRETKAGKKHMSTDYRKALEFVFDTFDLDENQQLDRTEYNLWTVRTTGDEINDNDWLSIREHLKLDVDESVSREKFLELNNYEVESDGTSDEELWFGLKAIGFNSKLELDMMCPYHLNVYMPQPDFTIKPASFAALSDLMEHLLLFLHRKGKKVKLEDLSVQCFHYQDKYGSILFAENNRSTAVQLSVRFFVSDNAALNLSTRVRHPHVITLERGSFGALSFAHKINNSEELKLEAVIDG